MLRSLSLLAILVAASIAWSGCTTQPDVDPGPTEEEPILHTEPAVALDEIDSEAARNRSHVHDYWGDEHEKRIIEETFRMGCFYCGAGSAFRYEGKAGEVIPQGTRWVNVTLSWTATQDSFYAEPHLWIETAADHRPWDAGPIESGDTIMIEVTNAQNDLPHETLSGWAFELHVTSGLLGTPYHLNGEATLVVEAARGNEIPVFPPHPDLWNGTTELVLFDQVEDAEPIYMGNPRSNTGNDWLGPHRPDNGTVVPYDMDHVTVVVTYQDDAPFPFTLGFHGAGTRDWILLEPDEIEGSTYTYTLTATDDRPDGPYALQSQWIFEVFADEEPPNLFMGTYSITATAHRDAA